MAWRCGGPFPHDAAVKNVAKTTSPTSSSKQAPRRSGTSTCGSSPVSGSATPVPSPRAVELPAAHHPLVQTKDVSVLPPSFEQFVLRSLIGSTAEEVRRRLGISAET